MALTPYVRTLPFAYSEGSEVLNAPNDLNVPGNWNTDGAWKFCIEPDQEQLPDEANCKGFQANDNVLVEAYRVVTPFADGLVVIQPRIEFRVFGLVGFKPNGVDTHDDFTAEHLFLDYSAPWGEWQECNRFIPAWTQMGHPNGTRDKWIGVKTYPVTLKTATLDPVYNGTILRMEIQLKVRHVYPMLYVNTGL